MGDPFSCPRCGAGHPALRAMNEAVLAIAAERSVEPVLQRMVHAARDLAHARYAALGTPDGEGGFERFMVSGMSDEQWDAIGRLPRTHGMLGAILGEARPVLLADIRRDPRFKGWPTAHPTMRSFMGVPIVSRGAVIGAFYLTERNGPAGFDGQDQAVVEMLAAHAALAIEGARLLERSGELTVMEERNRLARELHDSVTQTLFSAVFTAEAAVTLAERDPAAAAEQMRKVKELSQEAVREMRALIFELRPADLESEGLVATLRKHVDVLRRIYGTEISVSAERVPPLREGAEQAVFRVVQEALSNCLKHSGAERIDVALRGSDGTLTVTVGDDGTGFEPKGPGVRSRHLGLTSMEERAVAVGGRLRIDSTPGRGTRVRLEVPA